MRPSIITLGLGFVALCAGCMRPPERCPEARSTFPDAAYECRQDGSPAREDDEQFAQKILEHAGPLCDSGKAVKCSKLAKQLERTKCEAEIERPEPGSSGAPVLDAQGNALGVALRCRIVPVSEELMLPQMWERTCVPSDRLLRLAGVKR